MASIVDKQLLDGVQLLLRHIEDIQEEEQDADDIHKAFECFASQKYGLGPNAETYIVGAAHDRGIDGYSCEGNTYHLIQAKIPQEDWLAANPGKVRQFGVSAVDDAKEARKYLFEGSGGKAHQRIKDLFGRLELVKDEEDLKITYHLVIFGDLNKRANARLEEEQEKWEERGHHLICHRLEQLASDFVEGPTAAGKIKVRLGVHKDAALTHHDYHYFLTPASDVFEAFEKFRFRLFDLNVRGWLKNSAVNRRIIETLSSPKGRKLFHHLNNGLIIVADNISLSGNGFATLTGAQIVNGLQTTKAIHTAVQDSEVLLEDLADSLVQVKVITNRGRGFVDQIVTATNDQNPMKARNLKANTREQKALRQKFAQLSPRWFYEVKQEEWSSLSNENKDMFKSIVGFQYRDFVVGRVPRMVDNEKAAKAWLSLIGYSDLAGDRTSHYFEKPDVYQIAFQSRPTDKYWEALRKQYGFRSERADLLERVQGDASQYLLAFALWESLRKFIPSAALNKREAFDRGVKKGELKKASGHITSSVSDQETYLSQDTTYQSWRLMANMKELLVELIARLLVQRYGPLNSELATKILQQFDLSEFQVEGTVDTVVQAAHANTGKQEHVFARVLCLLAYTSTQYYIENRVRLLAQSRIRTVLLGDNVRDEFCDAVDSAGKLVELDKPWKKSGETFLESLPDLV